VQLVLLPGLDGTGLLFQPLLDELQQLHPATVVAYPTDRQLELSELADLVSRRLPNGKVVVLAESFSGLVLLSLLGRRPAHVVGAIFVGAFAEPPRPLLLRFAPLVARCGPVMRSAPSFLLRQYCLGKAASAAQIRMVREALAAVSPSVLSHRFGLVAQRHVLPGASVPCLYIRASDDRLVPAGCADWFQQRFEQCRIAELEGPHFLLQARPRQSSQLIAQMVKSLHAT
jgi:pimeloyl-[acyl-carrier protein] methyl ester esterase